MRKLDTWGGGVGTGLATTKREEKTPYNLLANVSHWYDYIQEPAGFSLLISALLFLHILYNKIKMMAEQRK